MSAIQLAPMEYRYALDAIMPSYAHSSNAAVICNSPELFAELEHRSIALDLSPGAEFALWIEPMADSWMDDLTALSEMLLMGGFLSVIASQPLSLILPERKRWQGRPLGARPGGISRLRSGLQKQGFKISSNYGIHSQVSMGLNALARLVSIAGRADIADQLHFSARNRYCMRGLPGTLSTVSLIQAEKVRGA